MLRGTEALCGTGCGLSTHSDWDEALRQGLKGDPAQERPLRVLPLYDTQARYNPLPCHPLLPCTPPLACYTPLPCYTPFTLLTRRTPSRAAHAAARSDNTFACSVAKVAAAAVKVGLTSCLRHSPRRWRYCTASIGLGSPTYTTSRSACCTTRQTAWPLTYQLLTTHYLLIVLLPAALPGKRLATRSVQLRLRSDPPRPATLHPRRRAA